MTMRRMGTLLLLASRVSARAEEGGETPPAGGKKAPGVVELAVIVHPKNPIRDVSFGELRAYLKMERQFWPNKRRCTIYLPPSKTTAHAVLLQQVYRMTNKKLQKYWVRKLFSGEIPAKPSYVPTAKAAGSISSRSTVNA